MNWFRVLTCLLVLTAIILFVREPAGAQNAGAIITNSVGMKLARIPAGKFLMGSPPTEAEREDTEEQHEVTISRPFYLGVHLVTQSQYRDLMGNNPSFFAGKAGGPDNPVDQVRASEAAEFCKKLSALPAEQKAGRTYRLPTEAEWEYACRAGTTTPFYCGQSLSSTQANFNGNSPYGGAAKGPYLRKPVKVGSYPPNAWGLYDMHGNLWQWCADFYDPDYYPKSPKVDPKGPDKGVVATGFPNDFYRVVRGGCWLDEGRGCRAARRFRLMTHKDATYRWVGFRVACDVASK